MFLYKIPYETSRGIKQFFSFCISMESEHVFKAILKIVKELTYRQRIDTNMTQIHNTLSSLFIYLFFLLYFLQVSTDYELLKRTQQESEEKLVEMTDRVSLLEKASRQLELNNETLAYKVCI